MWSLVSRLGKMVSGPTRVAHRLSRPPTLPTSHYNKLAARICHIYVSFLTGLITVTQSPCCLLAAIKMLFYSARAETLKHGWFMRPLMHACRYILWSVREFYNSEVGHSVAPRRLAAWRELCHHLLFWLLVRYRVYEFNRFAVCY